MKIAVVGGGPGGYTAAIRAAQLGGEVVLVEKNRIGGTCLNVGCIPTKAFLHSAEVLREAQRAGRYGILAEVKGLDWNKLLNKKNSVVARLTQGVEGLMKANGIEVVEGEAYFQSAGTLMVKKRQGGREELSWDRLILATGSVPALPPIPGVTGNPACMDSTGALSLEKLPKSLLVIGGGVIGIELGSAYSAFGAKVAVVEALPKLLPMMDGELTAMLRSELEEGGMEIFTDALVKSVEEGGAGAVARVELDGRERVFEAEKVLVAVGRRSDTEALHLEAAGIRHEKGRIQVNDQMETNVSGIYAIGDCLGRVMLAHVAAAQGETAAENAMGHREAYKGATNPSCVYTSPEFAGVGLTEEQAKKEGLEYKIGRFPLMANGRALVMDGGGMVKLLFGRKYGELLGAHILGPRATELIAEAALAMRLEATAQEFISTIHGHPTVAEAVREAAMAAENRAIHIPNR